MGKKKAEAAGVVEHRNLYFPFTLISNIHEPMTNCFVYKKNQRNANSNAYNLDENIIFYYHSEWDRARDEVENLVIYKRFGN